MDGDTSTPWADEIEQKVVLCPQVGMLSTFHFSGLFY